MYKSYAQEKGIQSLGVGIHTRLNDKFRISSIYRQYSNQYFCEHGWETFLWNEEKIAKEYPSLGTADQVIDLHLKIKIDYENGIDVTKDDDE